MNLDAIKSLSNSQWEDLLSILKEEIFENKKVINIKTEGKTDAEIAREVASREMASNIIKSLILRINRARSQTIKSQEKYI